MRGEDDESERFRDGALVNRGQPGGGARARVRVVKQPGRRRCAVVDDRLEPAGGRRRVVRQRDVTGRAEAVAAARAAEKPPRLPRVGIGDVTGDRPTDLRGDDDPTYRPREHVRTCPDSGTGVSVREHTRRKATPTPLPVGGRRACDSVNTRHCQAFV